MKLTCHIPQWNCTNKRIILRVDLNVPLKNGAITNDMRLRAIQPTLDALIEKNATIILLTHLGRPKEKDASLSTKHLVPWFKKNNYDIVFAPTLEDAQKETGLILLENLRFFPGEQDKSITFAKQLAQLGEYFVQDAFGALHKDETSITLLPEQFPESKRTIGLLVQQELNFLQPVKDDPAHPFCIILGGAKLANKIPLIEYMQDNADHILLCPALVFTFLKAEGKEVGTSLVDTKLIDTCKKILEKNKLLFPTDYMVAVENKDGPLSYATTLTDNEMGISIGRETVANFSQLIQQAQTIFYNGAMGFPERPETLQGMKALFQAMALSDGISIVAGGDSVAALEQFGIKGITHTSAGGGATLAYLSGKELPGLQPFQN